MTKFVPNNSYDFITNDSTNSPFSENVQLAYVLPPANHGLLLSNVKRDLDTLYSQYSVTEFSFQWAFCRYFWEAHAILPEVSIDVLHEWDQKWATAPKKSRIRKK